jgi:hypothetical protein
MKKLIFLFSILMSQTCFASMLGQQKLTIDFRRDDDIESKVKWFSSEELSANSDGLGFDGPPEKTTQLHLETTEPFALGYSWRPIQSARIMVKIKGREKPIVLSNGTVISSVPGSLFVRYSPDARNWSNWQFLQLDRNVPPSVFLWLFDGVIAVSHTERSAYQDLLTEYCKLDVPWKSDEDAAVRWILKKDPNFFKKQIPFIGYVQFLFESNLYGGQRIESIDINISYGVGGMYFPPKDEKVRKKTERDVPWKFKAN